MFQESRVLILKLLCLIIVAPLFASSLLYIIEKIKNAWESKNKTKKILALSMLIVFMEFFLGWFL